MVGYVNKIESMGLVDGPGIRTVIFMQGCMLRCIFCHNPESWSFKGGTKYTPLELVNKISRFKPYYGEDGGVTFSGGEPLGQPEFLLETCKLLKKENINICLDTSGVGTKYEELLDYIDLIILDIKHMTPKGYEMITGAKMDKFQKFLETVQRKNKKLWLRQVIVPGINDTKEYILQLKEYISKIKNVEKVELLPYHTMGVGKYKDLNIKYKLDGVPPMDNLKCKELEKILND